MILVVDDSPEGLYASTRTLRRAGHEVLTAGSAHEAELAWERRVPDLVLLDVNLPDGNGIELSHSWKAMPERATVPIVLRSAVSVSAAEQTLGLRSGADGYLIDPVEPEVLSATVAAHLRIRDLLTDIARSSQHAENLVRYGLDLAKAATPADVVALLVAEAARSLGACETHIRWRRSAEHTRHRRSSPGAPAGSVLHRLGTPSADGPRFHPDRAGLPADAGEPPDGQVAWAVLPFDDIEVSGTISLAFGDPQPMHEEQRRVLITFAGITALSLGRAAALDLYRSIAGTLQRALIPSAILLPGVAVERKLRVGEGATIAGGDWFDGYPLPSGEQAVLCGDVVGHGPEAAGASSIFRHTLWALLLSGTEPGAAIVETNRLVRTHPSRPQGTVLVVVISTARRRARIYAAGHVPPVLIGADGTAELVEVTPIPPLGMSSTPPEPEPTVVDLGPGTMLMLITDGVVEHRGHDIDDGYDRLRAAVGCTRTPRDALAAVDALLGPGTPADDALFAAIAIDP